MTREQAQAEAKAWTKGDVKCICGNNDLRSRTHVNPDTNEVDEIVVFCPKCSETVFRKTVSEDTVSEYSKFGGSHGTTS